MLDGLHEPFDKVATRRYFYLSSRLLEYEMCARVNARRLTQFHGKALRLLLLIFVGMSNSKLSPMLFRILGVFLPLIATNCAIPGHKAYREQSK